MNRREFIVAVSLAVLGGTGSTTRTKEDWVPVSERLPEPGEERYECLCMGQTVYIARRVDSRYGPEPWENDGCVLHGITHWRPLRPKERREHRR